jgi:Na+:H+ antiporter, NhaA family
MKALLRSAIDDFLLLPIGGLVAILWANLAPETYYTMAHPLTFWVNDVAMALFFAFITQEVLEEVMPGGALHGPRRWLLPLAAAAGAFAAAAMLYTVYVNWSYELALANGWPVATAIDVAVVYVVVRMVFRRHPAVSFALVIAIAAGIGGLVSVASRQDLVRIESGGITIMLVALGLAATMRIVNVTSFWPILLVCGPLSWWALYVSGINPALALVPLMLFVKHTPRGVALFGDRPHSAHHSRTHFEHVFRYPVHAVLCLFGLVNAGVVLSGYGTGTWAVLMAALIGKPVGLLLGAAAGVALGLHLPRGLHWRDLAVVALTTTGGFAFGLFFATAAYSAGPLLAELKLGVILSGVGVALTFVVAFVLKVGRFHAPGPTTSRVRIRHAAGVLLGALLVPVAASAQSSDDDAMATFQTQLAAYLDVRERARNDVVSEHFIDPRIRGITGALLGARLRELRPGAREEDVFSRAMSAVIRDRLHRAFDDVEVDAMLSSLYGDELPPFDAARVNFSCATNVLVVPPAGLLAALPPVPGMLRYRLAGRHLVLWDEEAHIIVDIVRDGLAQPRIWDFVDVSSFVIRDRIRDLLRRRGIDPAEFRDEMDDEGPEDWRPVVGEPFCWDASGFMPGLLIQVLPKLPEPLEYRFAGSDLVVVNVETGITMGVLHAALAPRARGPRV